MLVKWKCNLNDNILKINMLFHADNIITLKELRKTHKKAIKCAYLDPPYNTQCNRKHFQDTRSSKAWLRMMRNRIIHLKHLLRDDGSIWISIDDSELYNLKLLCDNILGKKNYLATVIWQHAIKWDGYQGKFKLNHTYLLGYKISEAFCFEDNVSPSTVWFESEVGGHAEALKESNELFGETNVFSTPKPEKLMRYLLNLTSKENDIIIDGFSGSGTMGAAAQKMGRYWIMIEIGDQCMTHILPRMNLLAMQHPNNTTRIINNHSCFFYFQNVKEYKDLHKLFLREKKLRFSSNSHNVST